MIFLFALLCALAHGQFNICNSALQGLRDGLTEAFPKSDANATDSNNHVYYFLPCGIADEFVKECPPGALICQKDGTGKYHSLGKYGEIHWASAASFILEVADGDDDRRAVVTFTCDEGAGLGTFHFVSEFPAKEYNFEWISADVCVEPEPEPKRPSEEDMSVGLIFLYFFLGLWCFCCIFVCCIAIVAVIVLLGLTLLGVGGFGFSRYAKKPLLDDESAEKIYNTI